MIGTSANWPGYPYITSVLGLRQIPQCMMNMITLLGINASISRGSYGSSWGSACEGSIGVSTRNMKYIHNDIVKPFKVKILCYAERVHDMHNLAKYLHPPSMRGKSSKADNCTIRKQEFTASDIRLAIKDGLPSSMQDDLEDHPEDYHSLT